MMHTAVPYSASEYPNIPDNTTEYQLAKHVIVNYAGDVLNELEILMIAESRGSTYKDWIRTNRPHLTAFYGMLCLIEGLGLPLVHEPGFLSTLSAFGTIRWQQGQQRSLKHMHGRFTTLLKELVSLEWNKTP